MSLRLVSNSRSPLTGITGMNHLSQPKDKILEMENKLVVAGVKDGKEGHSKGCGCRCNKAT
jgi:hypothetical protein